MSLIIMILDFLIRTHNNICFACCSPNWYLLVFIVFFSFSPHITFRTVFWSLFGRGEPTAVELTEFGHYFTETVGYWIFGVYNITTVIVLLNMLIAMMSRSFEIIQVGTLHIL